MDDFQTIAAITSCTLDVKLRSQRLAAFTTNRPSLSGLATYLSLDASALSVSIWVTRSNGTFVVAADTRHHAYEKRLQLHREQIFAKKLKHSSNSDDARAKGENGEYTDSSFLVPKSDDSNQFLETVHYDDEDRDDEFVALSYTPKQRMQRWMPSEEITLVRQALNGSSHVSETRNADPGRANDEQTRLLPWRFVGQY